MPDLPHEFQQRSKALIEWLDEQLTKLDPGLDEHLAGFDSGEEPETPDEAA